MKGVNLENKMEFVGLFPSKTYDEKWYNNIQSV